MHGNDFLNVEVDEFGKVVSVWYNCLALNFEQSDVDSERAKQMRDMYENNGVTGIKSIKVFEKND